MRKLLLLWSVLFILCWINVAHSATLTTIHGWWPNTWTDCGTGQVPIDWDTFKDLWIVPGSLSDTTCIPHTYYDADDYVINVTNGSIVNCDWEDRVISVFWSIMLCRKYDDIDPTIGYIISWWTTVTDTWTNQDVTVSIDCADTWGSWCDSATYEYYESDTVFTTCDASLAWWNLWGSKLYSPANNTNFIKYICYRGRDIAWNGYIYSWVAIIKIDKIQPAVTDIWNTLPEDNSNLIATDSQIISVSVWTNSWSSIVKIQWIFEDWNSPVGAYLWTIDLSNSDILDITKSIQNVDFQRITWTWSTQWSREYSFKITYIEDDAGNKLWILNGITAQKTFHYYVYADADPSTMITQDVTNNEFTTVNVADGSEKNLTITLEDQYWNEIVPASTLWNIWRTIDFNFNVVNNLNRNQYTQTQDAVYLNTPLDPLFSNKLTNNASFDTQTSSNGTYPFDFKVYAPTYYAGVNDGRELAYWNFNINSITYDLNQTVWLYIPPGTTWNPISGANITFNYEPLYKTEFSWDLYDYWFVEWATQSSQIAITRKLAVAWVSARRVYLKYFDSGLPISLKYSPSWTPISVVSTWPALTTIFSSNLNPWNRLINTLLNQIGGTLNDIQNTYLSTHISYNITAPNGVWTIPVVYNSDVIWKNNYWWSISGNNTTQGWIKVYWNTHSENYNQIVSTQDVQIIWKNTKSTLKRDLRKKVFEVIKNVPHVWDGSQKNLLNNTLEYYKFIWASAGGIKEINLWDYSGLTTDKTLVIQGWNVYIKWNILPWSHVLWIIVLKDANGTGWNIYIDPSVTQIHAIMYADKSLLSYNDLYGELALSNWWSQSTLNNQLYILGTVFTENTIGASRSTPAVCPYYIDDIICSTQEIAQKYDLNYLRRYFIYDSNSDGIIDSADAPANWWNSSFSSTDEEYFYPVVIRYNQKIQLSPPPLFE